jgi:hypothetical protein
MVFVGSEDCYVYAIPIEDPNNEGVIDTDELYWKFNTSRAVESSPLITADGKVLVGGDTGKLYCFDTKTGKVVWEYTTNNVICSSPGISRGKVFIGSHEGYMYCIGKRVKPPKLNIDIVPEHLAIESNQTMNIDFIVKDDKSNPVKNALVNYHQLKWVAFG